MRFFFIIVLLAALTSWFPRALAQPADSLQAVVNDRPITQQQIERLIGPEQKQLYDAYMQQPDVMRKKMSELWQDGSESLITREVILHDFTQSIKVPDSIIQEFVTDRIKDMEKKYDDHASFIKDLERQGTTMEQLRKDVRDRFIVEQMRMKFVPEPIISPLKIENYYVMHRDNFKLEDQIKMRMIFLNRDSGDTTGQARKRVEELHSQIQGGASFEQLARVYSEGSLRLDGGETGWEDFSVVNKALVPEVKKLNPGQCSGVIEAPEGYYLLMLEDRHPSHFRPLNEVRDQIERTLASQEMERESKQWIARLRKKTFVKYF
jgi:peptidyl-prolyl cis-trans isomerase SurA